ncbi:MAG: pyridoxamine 5'-phosphate oxidase family protein [Confluentibacter sp.]|nr:pyridoxamine 5'-phosphate oxidase family protein [Confluentibacter sp.]
MNDKNLTRNREGLNKIRQLIEVQKIVMMASRLDKIPFSVCPMTILEMDDQGDLWFFTSKKSGVFQDIEYDNRVQLLYSDEDTQKYVSIFGNASHIIDNEKVEALWNPMMNHWFDGKDDPDLVLLNINMEHAYYWNNDTNALVSFFELIEGGLTNKKPDLGKQGPIDLQTY